MNSSSTNGEGCEFPGVVIRPLARHADERGWLVELFRHDQLPSEHLPVMAYASETLPGEARGPHEHRWQSDCFAFIGPGDFKLYLWDARPDSKTSGQELTIVVGRSNPAMVIVPPGIVHAYQNVSEVPGLVFNAPNRLYAGKDYLEPVDVIRHEDDDHSPYQLSGV